MAQKKKMINWNATQEEVELIEALKGALGRSTTSDLLRHLVQQEAKKIFLQADMQTCLKQGNKD